MEATVLEAQEKAVVGGVAQMGRFSGPFADLNLLECEGVPGPLAPRRFRLKEWVHVGVIHPDFYLSIAVVDAGFLVTSWTHAYLRKTGRAFEHVRKLPPRAVRLPANLLDHRTELKASGYRIELHNNLVHGQHTFRIAVSARKALPAINAELVLLETRDRTHGLSVMLPLCPNRPMYTHKSACPVSGAVTVGDERFELSADRDCALLDFHKAYYPHRTFWNWATFAAQLPEVGVFGMNLTHNVVADDNVLNENCLWIGNTMQPLAAARFDIPEDPMQQWRIHTLDGRVEMTLAPQGIRRERIHLGLASSSYDQPYGFYSGRVVDSAGKRLAVDGAFGLAERHTVRW
ncbi:MAG: DUF2804 domain-containing protein [Deltaproteobacteria bacterium]|nr:DUF2804 domain-containing protein [Deltaproteobacteria bacterium]